MRYKDFAKEIKKHREHLGMTQKELARLIPTAPSILCKIENGKQEPSFFILQRIILLLDLDFNKMIKASNQNDNFYFD
jgi:predicted transcriptional regulator